MTGMILEQQFHSEKSSMCSSILVMSSFQSLLHVNDRTREGSGSSTDNECLYHTAQSRPPSLSRAVFWVSRRTGGNNIFTSHETFIAACRPPRDFIISLLPLILAA